MSAFVGVIVGLFTGLLSLFGLHSTATLPQLPPPMQEQTTQAAQQGGSQSTSIVTSGQVNVVPAINIDSSSLVVISGQQPTITGSATGVSVVAEIIIRAPSAKQGGWTQIADVKNVPVVNGRWSLNFTSATWDDGPIPAPLTKQGIYLIDAIASFQPLIQTTGTLAVNMPNSISIAGMSKYTDSDFGFSFWYPSGWTIQQHTPDKAPDTYFPGGVVQKSYNILDGNGNLAVSISTVASDAGSITLQDDNGNTYTLYFDKNSHTWMRCLSKSGVAIGDCAGAINIAPADVSTNSMGGLHIISTVAPNASDLLPDVIPLSAHNFVVVYHNAEKIDALARTMVALDPVVATPVSTVEQQAAIEAEQQAYAGQ
jgi:hypothetical protein